MLRLPVVAVAMLLTGAPMAQTVVVPPCQVLPGTPPAAEFTACLLQAIGGAPQPPPVPPTGYVPPAPTLSQATTYQPAAPLR